MRCVIGGTGLYCCTYTHLYSVWSLTLNIIYVVFSKTQSKQNTCLGGDNDIVQVVAAVVALAPPGRIPATEPEEPPIVAERLAVRLVRDRRLSRARAVHYRLVALDIVCDCDLQESRKSLKLLCIVLTYEVDVRSSMLMKRWVTLLPMHRKPSHSSTRRRSSIHQLHNNRTPLKPLYCKNHYQIIHTVMNKLLMLRERPLRV